MSSQLCPKTKQVFVYTTEQPCKSVDIFGQNLAVIQSGAGLGNVTVPTSPGVTLFNVMQGYADQNRTTFKVNLKSIEINIQLLSLATGTYGRLFVVYDKNPNTAAARIEDVIGSTIANGTASTQWNSPINYNNTDRFIFFMDEQVTVLTSLITNPVTTYKKKILLDGLSSTFNNTNGGTIADFNTGSILLFYVGTGGANSLNYHARVEFYDA